MECYKLIIEKNGKYYNYIFTAKTEQEKNAKLKAYKDENITPYDKVKLNFLGTLEEHEKLIYKYNAESMFKQNPKGVCWLKVFSSNLKKWYKTGVKL
jgi:hypothetical protein